MFPDLTLFYMSIFGGFGFDAGAIGAAWLGLASGISIAGNPPYSVVTFLMMHPKFFGPATPIAGTYTSGSNVITAPVTGIALGQLVIGIGIPEGAMVTGVGTGNFTISAIATASGTAVVVYQAPLVPLAIIQAYLNLAYASLMSSVFIEAWAIAMGLYIAHYLTLYLQTDGSGATNAAQAAAQGLQRGITISKAVGDTSVGLQAVTGLEEWGAWNLTQYGLDLITRARVRTGPTYVR